ncbi:hypothetical protein ACH5RR_016079 [Cinchona calisaya]|uniref:Pyridoxamine kinase/Phosphomethylpyrimidine kinase domain-containing protein n=1 Tax=Cinchona calisaya TaxID=153742 RepID=A0ABD2ZYC8_9GENT
MSIISSPSLLPPPLPLEKQQPPRTTSTITSCATAISIDEDYLSSALIHLSCSLLARSPRSKILNRVIDFHHVLSKEGYLPTSLYVVDILYDGKDFFEFHSSRIITPNTHGTGCNLASYIASELAKCSSVISVITILAKDSLVISAVKDEEDVKAIAYLFAEMGDSYVELIATGSDESMLILHALPEVASYPEFDPYPKSLDSSKKKRDRCSEKVL